jgi:hypothetical protein
MCQRFCTALDCVEVGHCWHRSSCAAFS